MAEAVAAVLTGGGETLRPAGLGLDLLGIGLDITGVLLLGEGEGGLRL